MAPRSLKCLSPLSHSSPVDGRVLTIRPITGRDDAEVARLIRTVMPEFGAVGPGFAIGDPEVDSMSAAYAAPGSEYFVVTAAAGLVGCGGYGPLAGGDGSVCELRKMYFLADARGHGCGRRLLTLILERAAAAGYSRCYLETMGKMHAAQALYRQAGFERLEAPLGATGHCGCDVWFARTLEGGA